MLPDNTLVSLVIPTLNEEKYIDTCLQSAFSQSYPAGLIEIIIVDGGSSDKTVDIVRTWQKENKNLYLLNNSKRIQAAAFNLATENSRGDIVIRWDAHCQYDPMYVHYCVLNHREMECGNVGGPIQVQAGSGTPMGETIALLSSSVFGLGGAAFRMGGEKKIVKTVPFGAFTRKVIIEIGKMNEKLPRGEDNEYNSRILRAGYKIILDPRIKSYYYSRSTLKMFLKQMYDNGFSVGVLLRLSIRYVNIRHIVPMLFVISLAIGALLSADSDLIRVLFLSVIAVYLILNISFSLISAVQKNIKLFPLLIWSSVCVHLAYGVGTIAGLIKGKYENE